MSKPIRFILNGKLTETTVSPGMVALDFVRQDRKLTGTKEGCKEGECGACTVLIGRLDEGVVRYKAVASCLLPVGELRNKHLLTIEGVNGEELTPIQQAFVDEGATQCGFCTPGFVMSLTGFFINSRDLSYDDALDAVDGNICRCTGYVAIRQAIMNLCDTYSKKLDPDRDRFEQLVDWGILPAGCREVPALLAKLEAEDPRKPGECGEDSVLVAGGTDLYVQRPDELLGAELRFISDNRELCRIRQDGDQIVIGGGVNVADMKRNPIIQKYFPLIREKLNRISSTIMRNRATVAGNIVNASPIGDLSVMFIALGARLELVKDGVKREIALKDFFKGYKKLDLQPGELVAAVVFDAPDKKTRFDYDKVSQRRYLDIASCNSAITLKMDGDTIVSADIAAGGVAAVPFYLKETAAFLAGRKVNAETVKGAADTALGEISPISDVRGTAEYKSLLLRQLIFGHFLKLFPNQVKFEEVIK